MVCIICGSHTQVTNSRPQKRRNQIWRRRECTTCHAVFTTGEQIEYGGLWRVRDQSGQLQPFSRDQLLLSIYKSCAHRETAVSDAAGLTDTIITKLSTNVSNGTVPSASIIQIVQVALNRFDSAASAHYAAFHRS